MIDLQINDEYLQAVPAAALTAAAEAALAHSYTPDEPGEADLTIAVTGDAEIQELNRQFMAVDAPTDVLSFPADELDPETGHQYLGDIMISFPRAQAQARQGGHSELHELQLLVVHGVLHLLGHDHADTAEKDAMWAAQAEILAKLGNPLTNPS